MVESSGGKGRVAQVGAVTNTILSANYTVPTTTDQSDQIRASVYRYIVDTLEAICLG